MEMRKYLTGDTEAVRPDQAIVFLDAPTVCYMATSNLLAVGSATQHKPLKCEQLRSRRKFDFRLPAKSSPIKHNCFLREPCELCDLAGFQPCHDASGFVQRPIDLFSGL